MHHFLDLFAICIKQLTFTKPLQAIPEASKRGPKARCAASIGGNFTTYSPKRAATQPIFQSENWAIQLLDSKTFIVCECIFLKLLQKPSSHYSLASCKVSSKSAGQILRNKVTTDNSQRDIHSLLLGCTYFECKVISEQ